MPDTNTWVQIIETLTPLVAVVAIGVTSWLPSYLTSRANRKLAIYSKRKEDIETFTKACGKYLGVTAILTSVLQKTENEPNNPQYVDDTIRMMVEYKFEILSYFDICQTLAICEKMETLETYAEELRQALIMQNLYMTTERQDKLEKQYCKISENIKPTIYDIAHDLQNMFITHKHAMDASLGHIKQKSLCNSNCNTI